MKYDRQKFKVLRCITLFSQTKPNQRGSFHAGTIISAGWLSTVAFRSSLYVLHDGDERNDLYLTGRQLGKLLYNKDIVQVEKDEEGRYRPVDEFYPKEEDHTGMILNPITGDWRWF